MSSITTQPGRRLIVADADFEVWKKKVDDVSPGLGTQIVKGSAYRVQAQDANLPKLLDRLCVGADFACATAAEMHALAFSQAEKDAFDLMVVPVSGNAMMKDLILMTPIKYVVVCTSQCPTFVPTAMMKDLMKTGVARFHKVALSKEGTLIPVDLSAPGVAIEILKTIEAQFTNENIAVLVLTSSGDGGKMADDTVVELGRHAAATFSYQLRVVRTFERYDASPYYFTEPPSDLSMVPNAIRMNEQEFHRDDILATPEKRATDGKTEKQKKKKKSTTQEDSDGETSDDEENKTTKKGSRIHEENLNQYASSTTDATMTIFGSAVEGVDTPKELGKLIVDVECKAGYDGHSKDQKRVFVELFEFLCVANKDAIALLKSVVLKPGVKYPLSEVKFPLSVSQKSNIINASRELLALEKAFMNYLKYPEAGSFDAHYKTCLEKFELLKGGPSQAAHKVRQEYLNAVQRSETSPNPKAPSLQRNFPTLAGVKRGALEMSETPAEHQQVEPPTLQPVRTGPSETIRLKCKGEVAARPGQRPGNMFFPIEYVAIAKQLKCAYCAIDLKIQGDDLYHENGPFSCPKLTAYPTMVKRVNEHRTLLTWLGL